MAYFMDEDEKEGWVEFDPTNINDIVANKLKKLGISIGNDVILDKNVYIGNRVSIGDGTIIGTQSLERDEYRNHINGDEPNMVTMIGRETVIGKKVRIYSHVSIYASAIIGDESVIGESAYIGGRGVIIGKRVRIGRDVTLFSKVTIGDGSIIGLESTIREDTFIGQGVSIGRLTSIGQETILDDRVSIGNNVTINYKTFIGRKVIIPDRCAIKKSTNISEGSSVIYIDIAPYSIFYYGKDRIDIGCMTKAIDGWLNTLIPHYPWFSASDYEEIVVKNRFPLDKIGEYETHIRHIKAIHEEKKKKN
jgi:acetyltransferase-like isoleucine patch superfamily enzyme